MNRFAAALVFVVAASSVPAGCKAREESAQSEVQSFGDTAQVAKAIVKLQNLIRDYKSAATAASRRAASDATLAFLTELDAKGVLKGVIVRLLGVVPATKSLPEDKRNGLVESVYGYLKVEMANRSRFDSWDNVEKKLIARVRQTDAMPLRDGLASLAGHPFLPLEGDELLINGEKSWQLREKLIADAKKTIWIFSWAFYDDQTGNAAADALLKKHAEQPEVDIRVLVDGPVGSGKGYSEVLQRMIDGGLPVVRWSDPSLIGYGMHRKVMIIDHETEAARAIFGGMNFGDNYSHKNAALTPLEQWRDTDMTVAGAPVRQAARVFATVWNDFVSAPGKLVSSPDLTKLALPELGVAGEVGQDAFQFVDQYPSQIAKSGEYLDPVYLVTLRMIESARQSIEISNAYFILSAPIENALKRAADRGVRVSVHTNADASLTTEDKPLLGPIYASLMRLTTKPKQASAKFVAPTVFLQKDHTLHSKYMVVDGLTGWVGSYNIHPRSYRYEGETVGLFHGPGIGGRVQQMFADDAAASDRTTDSQSFALPNATLYDLVGGFFFDQL